MYKKVYLSYSVMKSLVAISY